MSGAAVVVREGRFGPYVTDGETNASLRVGDTVEAVTIERAAELLADRRARGPAKAKRGAKKAEDPKKAGSKKIAAKKTGVAKKAGATAKKIGATKAGSKKKAVARKTPIADNSHSQPPEA